MSRPERQRMVERRDQALSLSQQCRLLDLSRSTLYYRPKGESAETLAVMRRIDELFLAYPFYGSRQMVRHLHREDIRVGRHRVRRLMRLMGIEAIYQAPRTSKPHPEHRVYPYLPRGLTIERPNHVWCADITYIPVRGGFLYLVGGHGLGESAGAVLAACRTRSTPRSVSRLSRRPWLATASRRSSIRTRAASSRVRTSLGRTQDSRGEDLDGRPRSMHRQRLHRTPVALAEVRGRLPSRTRGRRRGAASDRRVARLLQRRAASFGSWRSDSGRGLPQLDPEPHHG